MDAGLLELSFFLSSESDSESDPELEELYESFLTLEDSISADTQAAFSCTANQPEVEEEEKKHMLYEGAAVTTFQTILLVYQFVLRHSFSTKTFTEFLQLLAVLLPKTADLPKSVYLFKKKLASLFPEAQSRKHYYCTTCQMPVEKDGVCDCGQTNISQFITVPLQPQLRRLMEDPSSWNLLQQRFTRLVSDDIQDIYDGKGYKQHQHFLNHPAHISLSLNTDGVSLFRSSKAEIWPVWIVVNELPKNKRFLRKHMILAALWYAVEDPCVNTYLRPIIDEVNDLYLKGFPVSTPDGDMTARALLLLCSMDLPARARVMNMKKFNGYCGCLFCYHPGVTRVGQPLHRFWPKRVAVLRTHDELVADARSALTTGKPVRGVVGPSVLGLHRPFSLVTGVVVDDLHGLYLGVTKTLLGLWFNNKYKQKDFYIGDQVSLCDSRLLSIQVPDVLSRLPKSLEDIGHWKGSELRSWLFYYSLPVLSGILPDLYFNHLSRLVAGVRLLSAPSLSRDDLSTAETALVAFYDEFGDLYGEPATTYNVHLIQHLTKCVEEWGPLWAYTCFAFEDLNHHIKKLFHGTRDMTSQMAFCHVVMQGLPSLTSEVLSSPSIPLHVQTLFKILLGLKRSCNRQAVNTSVAVLGGATLTHLEDSLIHTLSPLHHGQKVQTFYRVEINGQVFYSYLYGRTKKRNSYTVSFTSDVETRKFGQIKKFVCLPPNKLPYAVIQILQPNAIASECFNSDPAVDHLSKFFRVDKTDSLEIVPATCLLHKCVYIEIEHSIYIVEMDTDNIILD